MKTYLECHGARVKKFFEIIVKEHAYTVREGTLGTKGKTRTRKCSTANATKVFSTREISNARKAGFKPVVPGRAAPKAATTPTTKAPATRARVTAEPRRLAAVRSRAVADLALMWGASGYHAFLPDARVLTGGWGRVVRVWSATTGKVDLESAASQPTGTDAISASMDGSIAASACENLVLVWSVDRMKPLAKLRGHRRGVSDLAFDGAGKLLASSSYDGTVRLWSVPDGKLKATLRIGSPVRAVALSSDGTQLVAAAEKGLALWDVAMGKLVRTFSGHAEQVMSVELGAGGRELVSSNLDQTVRRWDVASGRCLDVWKIDGEEEGKLIARWAGATRVLSLSEKGTLQLWAAGKRAAIARAKTPQSVPVGLAVRDGLAVVGSEMRLFRLS